MHSIERCGSREAGKMAFSELLNFIKSSKNKIIDVHLVSLPSSGFADELFAKFVFTDLGEANNCVINVHTSDVGMMVIERSIMQRCQDDVSKLDNIHHTLIHVN